MAPALGVWTSRCFARWPTRSADRAVLRHPGCPPSATDVLEGLRAILRARAAVAVRCAARAARLIHGLPLKMRFKRSKIYLSGDTGRCVGLIIGFIGAVDGIGGGSF